MSISSEITRINTNIANSYTAVDGKGGTLPATQNSANLASAINSIEVIESATAEGESLNLANTKAMPYSDYAVKGKSEQETRSGKNLFKNIPFTSTQRGLTITNDGNSIKVTGTAVSEYYSSIIFYADGSYENYEWWATDGKINPTKGYFNSNQAKNVLSVISNNATTEPWFRLLIGRETQVEATNVNFGETSTTIFNENTEKINFIALGFLPDKTYNTEFKIQIEQGSATSYEPYGASPSPDYPSEIHSVADDVNLLNVTNKTATLGGASYTAKNGEIIINGQSTQNASIIVEKVYLKANTNYYFSYNNNNSLNGSYFFLDDHGTYIFFYQDRTFTVSQTKTYAVSFVLISGNYNNLKISLKVQKGTVVTPYSEHGKGTVTIKQRGKNVAYTGWAENFVNAVNNPNSVYITTKDGRNCLRYPAGAGYNNYDIKNLSLGIKFKENTQYTISFDILKENKVERSVGFRYTDNTFSQMSDLTSTDTWQHITVTSIANKTIKWLEPLYTAGISYIDIDTWQIEERYNTNPIRTISR